MLGRALAKVEPHPTTTEKLLTKLQIQWAQISQQVIQKLFRSLRTEVTRMNNRTRWSSTLLSSFLSFFSCTPTWLNWSVDLIWTWCWIIFVCFCIPILQTLLDISFKMYLFICFLKKTKLISIFQTFVPQYIMDWPKPVKQSYVSLVLSTPEILNCFLSRFTLKRITFTGVERSKRSRSCGSVIARSKLYAYPH